MSQTEIRLSVALVTRNRPESLRRCLNSLREQSFQPYEVVVSDDSDEHFDAETRLVAAEFGARYLKGPQKGLYANRNFAALHCDGSHIRTMDDDHTFPEGHFGLCLEAIKSDPGAIWTTGEVGIVDGTRLPSVNTANQLHPSGLGYPPEDPDNNWSIADGSSIYPAAIFSRGFRFVESFKYGLSYLEFGAYLYHHGYRCRCVQGAMVAHYATAETLNRTSIYDRGVMASRLYAILAYNLFFRPDFIRTSKYITAVLYESRCDLALIREIPAIFRSVRSRWTATVDSPVRVSEALV